MVGVFNPFADFDIFNPAAVIKNVIKLLFDKK
jgi:hypothetical protein